MKIYLDNCCFNRPFDDQTYEKIYLESHAKLFVQQKILDGKLLLVWSYILDYENQQNPFLERKISVGEWRKIAVEMITENENILSYAEKLLEQGIKVKDALHIASAIEAGCTFFLTTDKKLLNTPNEKINVINPIDFVTQHEEQIK